MSADMAEPKAYVIETVRRIDSDHERYSGLRAVQVRGSEYTQRIEARSPTWSSVGRYGKTKWAPGCDYYRESGIKGACHCGFGATGQVPSTGALDHEAGQAAAKMPIDDVRFHAGVGLDQRHRSGDAAASAQPREDLRVV